MSPPTLNVTPREFWTRALAYAPARASAEAMLARLVR